MLFFGMFTQILKQRQIACYFISLIFAQISDKIYFAVHFTGKKHVHNFLLTFQKLFAFSFLIWLLNFFTDFT